MPNWEHFPINDIPLPFIVLHITARGFLSFLFEYALYISKLSCPLTSKTSHPND